MCPYWESPLVEVPLYRYIGVWACIHSSAYIRADPLLWVLAGMHVHMCT